MYNCGLLRGKVEGPEGGPLLYNAAATRLPPRQKQDAATLLERYSFADGEEALAGRLERRPKGP